MTERDPVDELGTALFAAARRERPRDDVRERVLAALVLAPSPADVSAPSPELVVPAAPLVFPSRHRRYGMLVALGLAATVMLAVVVIRSRRQEPLIAISAERGQAGVALGGAHDAPGANLPRAEDPPAPVTAPLAEPSVKRARPRDAGHTPGAQREDHEAAKPVVAAPPATLTDEIATLDRARTALSGGDPGGALRALDEYDQVLHGTRLTAEATLLRIDALGRSGQPGAASDLATRFVDANPGSALADRARAFIHVAASTSSTASTAKGLGVDSGGLP